jgi:hypothetical protein
MHVFVNISLNEVILFFLSFIGERVMVLVVSATNKTDRHDITEILLKVALNTITLSPIKDKKNKITSLREILTKTCIYL